MARSIWRRSVALGFLASGLGVASVPEPRVGALVFDAAGARLSIGALSAGPWWRIALAQAAETVTVENVSLEAGGAIYRIPRAEFHGTNLSGSDLRGLFDAASREPAFERVKRLTASRITIPELTVEQTIGSQAQVTTYRGLVAEDVLQGVIAKASAQGGTMAMSGGQPGSQTGSIGRMTISGLDLAATARFLTERAGADLETKQIYAAFSVEDLRVDNPDGGLVVIGRMSGEDVRARPLKESWSEVSKSFEPGGGSEMTPERRARLFRALADLIAATSVRSFETTGIAVKGPPGPDTPDLAVARLAYAANGSDGGASLTVEGLEVVAPGTQTRIGTISFSGLSAQSSAAALEALAGKPSITSADLRRLMPPIGNFRLGGLAFEGSAGASGSPEARPVRFGVREVSFSANRSVAGIPTDLRFGFTGFSLAVPPNPPEGLLRTLGSMGYPALDLSSALIASWNEGSQELAIRDLTVSGPGMGSTTLRGVLGNVSKDAFDPDTAVAMVALAGATAKTAELTVANEGLFERVLTDQARRRGKSPDELRRDLGTTAAVGVAPMLGNSPAAKAIGQAVARFIVRPGRFTITARARDPEGLGIADVSALGDAGSVLDRLEVAVSAE